MSNTIFQHFILLQYAILLLIVSCKDDCVLESVRPKTVELMLNLIVFEKQNKKKENKEEEEEEEELSLLKDVSVVFFFSFLSVC